MKTGFCRVQIGPCPSYVFACYNPGPDLQDFGIVAFLAVLSTYHETCCLTNSNLLQLVENTLPLLLAEGNQLVENQKIIK